MKQELINIANGVDGIFIENKRFNTTVISFNYYLPLIKEDVAANALLPYILTSCSEKYENLTVLNRKFNMLYGADLSLTVNKTGDTHHVRIAVSVINDRFSFWLSFSTGNFEVSTPHITTFVLYKENTSDNKIITI